MSLSFFDMFRCCFILFCCFISVFVFCCLWVRFILLCFFLGFWLLLFFRCVVVVCSLCCFSSPVYVFAIVFSFLFCFFKFRCTSPEMAWGTHLARNGSGHAPRQKWLGARTLPEMAWGIGSVLWSWFPVLVLACQRVPFCSVGMFWSWPLKAFRSVPSVCSCAVCPSVLVLVLALVLSGLFLLFFPWTFLRMPSFLLFRYPSWR